MRNLALPIVAASLALAGCFSGNGIANPVNDTPFDSDPVAEDEDVLFVRHLNRGERVTVRGTVEKTFGKGVYWLKPLAMTPPGGGVLVQGAEGPAPRVGDELRVVGTLFWVDAEQPGVPALPEGLPTDEPVILRAQAVIDFEPVSPGHGGHGHSHGEAEGAHGGAPDHGH